MEWNDVLLVGYPVEIVLSSTCLGPPKKYIFLFTITARYHFSRTLRAKTCNIEIVNQIMYYVIFQNGAAGTMFGKRYLNPHFHPSIIKKPAKSLSDESKPVSLRRTEHEKIHFQ